MRCESSHMRRLGALVVVMVGLVFVGCIAAAGAQPAASRAEAATDNGLRQSHSARSSHRHSNRAADRPRMFCGKALRDELARVCEGRGYNGMGYIGPGSNARGPGPQYEGAATHCCQNGCTMKDLDSYCNPRTTDSSVSASFEEVSESTSYEVANTATSNNQLRTDPVVQEEPKSVSIGTNAQQDAEVENALFRRGSFKHKFYVKTNDYHQLNSPVTPRRQSTIR